MIQETYAATEVAAQDEFALEVKKSNIDLSGVSRLEEFFRPLFAKAREWSARAHEIVVTSEDQLELMRQARDTRLTLRAIRLEVEEKRKEMKESIVREGKAIDGIANVVKAVIEPLERHLMTQEKFAELAEEKRKETRKIKRMEELSSYQFDGRLYPLDTMEESSYKQLLDAAMVADKAKKEAAARAQEELQKKQRKEQLHRDRKDELVNAGLWSYMDTSGQNLADLTSEDYSQLHEQLETRKANAMEEQQRMQAENARLKAEADRLAKEAADRQAREEAELKKQQDAREAAEAKLKQEQDRQAREEADRLAKAAADQQAREEAERKARNAPDREKLNAVATQLDNITMPEVTSREANELLTRIKVSLAKMAGKIREESSNL